MRIKVSEMIDTPSVIDGDDLLHLISKDTNTKLKVSRFFEYLSDNGYPKIHVQEPRPADDLGKDGDICYSTNPFPSHPGPWIYGPKDATGNPANPWGEGVCLLQGPQGEGRVNSTFYESLKKLDADYECPSDSNVMSAGPTDLNGFTVTIDDDAQWTSVGTEDLSPKVLRDMVDVQIGETVYDREALLWHDDAKVWKPGPAPMGPRGPAGEDGKSAVGIQFQGDVDNVADLPGYPDKYTGDNGDAYWVKGDSHLWAWSSTNKIWLNLGNIEGPPGHDGADGADGSHGADGADGKGFTGGYYEPEIGVVTFTSDDGIGFQTGDLRGADGIPLEGTITLYSKADLSEAISAGWRLCDGTQGTPDLSSEFITHSGGQARYIIYMGK